MRKPTELLLVPMIDIFTVLVTFLLMTAVFSRIAIVELDLPSAASAAVSEPSFRLEVIVREEGLELTNGSALIAAIPKVDGAYDHLIQVMDAIRTAEAPAAAGTTPEPTLAAAAPKPARIALFTDIAVGDAP